VTDKSTPGALWSSRFDAPMGDATLLYTETTAVDKRLLDADLWCDLAHCIMLAEAEIIPDVAAASIASELLTLRDAARRGEFVLDPQLEDVHLNLESHIIDTLGLAIGGRLHTARSRNDQVVTDCRIYLRSELLDVVEETTRLARVLLRRGMNEQEVVLPLFTHSQIAQPASVAFWACAHAAALQRDLERLQLAFDHTNTSPLGAAACGGTSLPIVPRRTAELLGFKTLYSNALDATSARDFVGETLAAFALLMVNLSRLAEELVWWSTSALSLVDLGDSFSTGSSIMPQKRNPVVAELLKAKTGAVCGHLMEFLLVTKGLPLGYSCDLQQDKPGLWRAIDTVRPSVRIATLQVESMSFNEDASLAMLEAGFACATELANHMVRTHAMPFRQAYGLVGNAVRVLAKRGRTFRNGWDIARTELVESGQPLFSEDEYMRVTDPRVAHKSNTSWGGTSPERITESVHSISSEIEAVEHWISEERNRIAAADNATTTAARSLAARGG